MLLLPLRAGTEDLQKYGAAQQSIQMREVRLLGRLVAVLMVMSVGFLTPSLVGAGTDAKSQLKMDKVERMAKTVVLIGASYARGWPSDKPIAGYRMINKGVDGQQSFEMLVRFESDVLALKPDGVIIWGFINDVFRSDQAQIAETLRRTRESIVAMAALARKAGITPILATEVTIRGKEGWSESLQALIGSVLGKSSYQDYVNGHVKETNRWLRELAVREGIGLLDLETVLVDQQGVRRKDFSQPDGSHISKKGYEALIGYAETQVQTVIGIP